MSTGDLELANQLFASATALLEDALELAVAGQSPRLGRSQLADLSHRLASAARNIGVLADSAAIAAGHGSEGPQNKAQSGP